MTTQQIAPPSPVAPLAAPYAPSWALYVYDDRGYLTFDGRLIATAMCATPAPDAHIESLFRRLSTTHTSRVS